MNSIATAGNWYDTIDDIIATGLHEFIGDVQRRLNHTGDAIYRSFCQIDAAARGPLQEQLQ